MGKVALLFPGQGAQKVGMGSALLADYPELDSLYLRADEILGRDLRKVIFEGPEEVLNSTAYSQPAIFVTSLAALEVFKKTEPEKFDAVQAAAGLSLGEYTALVFAGSLSFEDGLRLVQKRADAMQAAADSSLGGMVSLLGLDLDVIEQLCQKVSAPGPLKVANYLCPKNTVVSGAKAACEEIAALALKAGAIKAVPLAVAGAFHTEMMASAAESLAGSLASAEFKEPHVPVISNVDTRSHGTPDDLRKTLLSQLTSPVRWEESMRALLADGFDEFYEIGPGRVLRGLMKRIERHVTLGGIEC